ncbi:MAG TPA: AAA family ATPase [Candidatus Saccharimonas sp.]|nr:AAA family ATPase [Candidatus Saccharimonas sp.]
MARYSFNPRAIRVRKARLSAAAAPLAAVLFGLAGAMLAGAAMLVLTSHHLGWSLAGLSLLCLMAGIWLRRDVLQLPAAEPGSSAQLDALLPSSLLRGYRPDLTAGQWLALLLTTWQAQFVVTRSGLTPSALSTALGQAAIDHDALWDEAVARTNAAGHTQPGPAALLAALLGLAPAVQTTLTAAKLTSADLDTVVGWAMRFEDLTHAPKPIYGGLARDWASGFTPQLMRYGQNLSLQVETAGRDFNTQERTTQADALISGLESATGSVALIGEPGIGKTALLYGLADDLLQGRGDSLAHHQIFSLNASIILGKQADAGGIEQQVLALINEAVHAGNIILAFDEAQLFFGQGTGAINLSQVLLPILQGRHLRLILTLTPGDWQKLKAAAPAMASLVTPLVLSEPGQADTLGILADRGILMEQGRFATTYQALMEAYRLAGRYAQDEAYPGKALKLLEAAMNHPQGALITAASVAQAVESQLGVKVQQADTAESDVLLHLEDRIHERMINQTRAVSVVAGALRRARAGVANPKRPLGSFLFLGPTGVGKTELARSLAALYFGTESHMIRLDMSEYQQPADVARLLAAATDNPDGLLPKVRQTPFSVVLFDEIEKAHPNLLNLFLQLLDEGQLTDSAGKPASFKDSIIIATSNAGADDIRQRIEAGESLETFEPAFIDQLINSGQFKPELLNRFDDIVLFRPLNEAELGQIVGLLITEVNRTLEPQKVSVSLTPAAVAALVREGYDPRLGARPMRREIQRRVEDAVAGRILRGQAAAGTAMTLDVADLSTTAQPSG